MPKKNFLGSLLSLGVGAAIFATVLPLSVQADDKNHTYFYNQLSATEKIIYTRIDNYIAASPTGQALSLNSSDFQTSGVSLNNISRAYDAFRYDHAEVFWIDGMNYTINSDKSVNISFKQSSVNAYHESSDVEAKLDAMAASIQGSTRYEQVKDIYIKTIELLQYDTSITVLDINNSKVRRSQHLPSAVINNNTVCAGYAKMVQELCDRLGIPAVLVTGVANNGQMTQNHMWNMIQMEDGKWYALDATWGDVNASVITSDYFLIGANSVSTVTNASFIQSHTSDNGLYSQNGYSFSYPSLSTSRYSQEPLVIKEISTPISV